MCVYVYVCDKKTTVSVSSAQHQHAFVLVTGLSSLVNNHPSHIAKHTHTLSLSLSLSTRVTHLHLHFSIWPVMVIQNVCHACNAYSL